ncbi:MAG TPA: ComEA family DNA-binding protein [Gaiellaceae bacterium]
MPIRPSIRPPIRPLGWSLTLAQRRRLAIALLCLVAAIVAWRHLAGGSSAASLARTPPPLVPRAAPQPVAAKRIVVDVVGAVRATGLYRLPEGARVADAVRAAGGLTRRADPLLVNLAAPVSDGEQVVVAARGSPGAATAGAGAGGTASAPVDLNSATAEQLDALPGVGPVTAQKIVAFRQQHGPFRSTDDLDAIPGIGPARIKDLQGLVVP